MIKRLSLIIILMSMVFVAQAKRISEVAAYARAAQAARSIIPDRKGSDLYVTLAYKSDGYYVYNFAGGGFVIVSGSDLTDDVLGYSRTGSFNACDIPENMAGILDGYKWDKDLSIGITTQKQRNAKVVKKIKAHAAKDGFTVE